ncbi:hypothetical protein ACFFK0_17050 [Paenibacillus chartarius]|uniref:Uncharacterized protein n=1 Tax=Paenibacillus chartarius TaxID=747481 RepID=A0ABV6DNA9_9BACL
MKLLKAFTVGLAFVGVYYVTVYFVVPLLVSMYVTATYKPDIYESYPSVDILDHQVSFGVIVKPAGLVFETLGLLLLGVIVYYFSIKLKGK